MATQRRFEGPTLAAVLATVQKEIGANAKITSAKKIRTGGVMGFFQRERYEVLVDTPSGTGTAGQAAQPPAADQPAATSLLELAEAVNTTEKRNDKPAVKKAKKAPSEPAVAAAKPDAPTVNTTSVPKRPAISTESDTFAEVLSRVAFQADMTSDSAPEPSSAAPENRTAPVAKEPDEPKQVVDSPVVGNQPAHRPTVLNQVPAQSKPQPVRTRITDSPLARIGVPAQYIPATFDEDGLDKSLLAIFKTLPKVPVVEPTKGSIVAVVGTKSDAEKVAAELCERWGCNSEEVVVASRAGSAKDESIIRSTRQAENSRRSWSRRNEPTVVAIDAEAGSKQVAWAERMLAAFEPIATWGVADASKKSEDLAAWAESLGGIDCLAVQGCEKTVSPASVLAAGIPIDTVDGHTATPSYWTALVTERLEKISS